jgi:DNA-binding MarR family transcriptional regulator
MFAQNDRGSVDYQALAELRYQIRRFLRSSEDAARSAGLEPQQHQLLLAIKGLPQDVQPTVGELAERLQIRHHSVVELIDRLAHRGYVRRRRSETDRRKVFVDMTPEGEEVLHRLTVEHEAELRTAGPALLSAIKTVVERSNTGEEAGGKA